MPPARTMRPLLRRPPSALQPRVPRRGEHPGVAVRGAGRPVLDTPGRSSFETIPCQRFTVACATTRARTPVTAELDEPVSIHAVERFLGDLALKEGWTIEPDEPPSGKRVLVVGAGPSGLSAAWHLARRGHPSSSTTPDRSPAA